MATSELALVEASATIGKTLERCNQLALRELAPLVQGFRIAQGISHLRQILDDDVMRVLMDLQGNPLGFLSDKTYEADVVRECAIEAMLLGLRPVGNEFNIIAGRCYAAKNGLLRLVREFPGLTNLEIVPGVCEIHGATALQPMRATWLLHGEPQSMARDKTNISDERIMVRVNSGMGPDAIVGKATRKLAAAIYERLSGLEIADETVTTSGRELPPPAPPAQDGRRMRMGQAREREPGQEG